MSIKVMSAVWENPPVRQGALLVLLAMADYCDERGVCWPSVPNLGKKARVSERHARRILRQLERAGLIKKERMTGRYEPNIYRVLPDRGDILSPLGKNEGGHLEQSGGTSETSRGDTQTPQSVKRTVTLEPSLGYTSTLERHKRQQEAKTG